MSLYSWIFQRKKNIQPWKFLKVMWKPFGNSKVKNQTSWKFIMILSWSTLEIPLLIDLWNFCMRFLQYPPKIPCPQAPLIFNSTSTPLISRRKGKGSLRFTISNLWFWREMKSNFRLIFSCFDCFLFIPSRGYNT